MPKVKLYNGEGKTVGETELRADVFGVKVNPEVVHEVMVGLMTNARQPLAHTKTKGEVRGGGKKPWKQKGTGRARQGSTRNPQWIGGGVAFGPRKERNYDLKINRKMKRQAMCMTLSDKVAHDRLVLVDDVIAANGKTKEVSALLSKLPVKGKLLLVSAGSDAKISRATRNIKEVRFVTTASLAMNDVLKAAYVVTTPAATAAIEKMYAKNA